jgi:hypothetical protein
MKGEEGEKQMAKTSGGGGKLLLLLVLLTVAGGAGAWNYRRNLQAEEAEPRPFRSYSDADLESLEAAYQQEIEVYTRRYETLTGQGVVVREGGHIDDKIREFERVQRISRSTRELVTQLARRHVAVEGLASERHKRIEESQPVKLFFKRLLVYAG